LVGREAVFEVAVGTRLLVAAYHERRQAGRQYHAMEDIASKMIRGTDNVDQILV
jgi:hypothetical protein